MLAALGRIVSGGIRTALLVAIGAAVVVLAGVALRTGTTAIAVPIGPSGAVMHLALDPLSASFLLLLFLVAPVVPTSPLPLAGAAVTLLAGDAFGIAGGVLLLGGHRL